MTARVIATAGHVDHGKSTLVRALTGTDPDRWEEEKSRGLTIDLGFADTVLPSGRQLSFVDVPGHVRFLRNMLAGVGAVDLCLFVVAATEGWKEQSEEHLRILGALDHRAGVVAITKRDLVDARQLAVVSAQVRERLKSSFLEGADVVAVDAAAGTGLDELRAALDGVLDRFNAPRDPSRPRLWIDRSFPIAGAGTVVTGTLIGGPIAVGDKLHVVPCNRTVRVRALQSHHRATEMAEPGTRVAVNLAAVNHREVSRGDALIRPGDWHLARTVDASLEVLASLHHRISGRGAHLAYIGSGEFAVRMRVLGPGHIEPGHRGFVRLHLPRPAPLVPGDRFVLRDAGRQVTIGGGEILDLDPVLPPAQAKPSRCVERVLQERGWVDADDLRRLTGVERPTDAGRWCVAPDLLRAARTRLLTAVRAALPLGLDLAGLDERDQAVLHAMAADGLVRVLHGRAFPPPKSGDEELPRELDDHPYLIAARARPFQPPAPTPADRGAVRELVRQGRLVDCGGVFFTPEAVADARRLIAAQLAEAPEGITLAGLRDALATSRRFALALLEYFDSQGATRRLGDRRVAGPRLEVPNAFGAADRAPPTRNSFDVD